MKKIPYGIQKIDKIMNENFLIIDKTNFIEKIEEIDEPYIVFLRPRKFGKSLWINIMETYYDISRKDEFNKIFGNLEIGKNPTKLRNEFFVLRFDFSGIQTKTEERVYLDFKKKILKSFDNFILKYKMKPIDFDFNDEPATLLGQFLFEFEKEINGKIYLLIDEYDHFTNELLGFNIELFKNIVSRIGFVRKFYEIIKQGAQSVIDKIFITGVSPITLDGFTSGFNIAANVTTRALFNEMMGFTEKDIDFIIKELQLEDLDRETIRKYYNGYKFSEYAEKRVYNSDMILYYFKEIQYSKKGPEKILDTNITTDYRKLRNILENSQEYPNILERILFVDEIGVELTREFNLEKKMSRDDMISLLFYLGFLTIKRASLENLFLTVPNFAIRTLYFDYFRTLIEIKNEIKIEVSDIKQGIEEIALLGTIDTFLKKIELILRKCSNRDFIKFEEKSIKMIFLSYLMLSRAFTVKSEYEVEDGYIDIALFSNNPAVEYEALIELKYIKKSEKDSKKLLEVKKKEAFAQLKQYKSASEFEKIKNLKKFAIVFVGAEGSIFEEGLE